MWSSPSPTAARAPSITATSPRRTTAARWMRPRSTAATALPAWPTCTSCPRGATPERCSSPIPPTMSTAIPSGAGSRCGCPRPPPPAISTTPSPRAASSPWTTMTSTICPRRSPAMPWTMRASPCPIPAPAPSTTTTPAAAAMITGSQPPRAITAPPPPICGG